MTPTDPAAAAREKLAAIIRAHDTKASQVCADAILAAFPQLTLAPGNDVLEGAREVASANFCDSAMQPQIDRIAAFATAHAAKERAELLKTIRSLAIVGHSRLSDGGKLIPNGQSCSLCNGEWGVGAPEDHAPGCLARTTP